MTVPPRRLVIVCGLVPTVLTAVLSLYRPSALASAEHQVYDGLLRSAPTRTPAGRIVIVDVDERSLSAVGQWPWRRDIVGDLIARLRDLGASTVALDVMFAESDRSGGKGDSTDAALAETLRAGRVVLGYGFTFDEAHQKSSACVQHPIGLAIVRRGDEGSDTPFFHATSAICTLPLLTHAAGSSGFLNAAPDPDGRLRRAPLLLELDGRVYPSLALAAAAGVGRARDVTLRVINVNTSSLVIDGERALTVPLDGKSNLLLRYRGPKHTFPYVSAADVLSGQAKADDFKDKIAFVGTTALGTREVVATPLDTLFAGVEVQATVADNLLQQDFIQRPEHGVAIETQAVIGLGIVAALLVAQLGLVWGGLGVALCLAGLWAAASALMSRGVFVSPLFPGVSLASTLAATAFARFTLEHRRADRALVEKASSQRLMVQSLLSLTEVRDVETGRHSRRTQQYARMLADALARHPQYRDYLTAERVELLSSLAPLHDIGKVGVPDDVLHKPGALDADELEKMRKHPVHGHDVILNAERDAGVHDDVILAMAKDIVYTHHEKWDGSGYPQGLRGTQIPIAGRLMAVVDVYDAAVTRRLYRTPLTHEDAVTLIRNGKGTHFDPAVVDAFLTVAGDLRRLSHES
jgi:HD-GYP domain-containing protein (c-di-GMP phosphodiesterase class II)